MRSSDPSWFGWLTVFWLWLTVVFANLAEAVAEGRGKAQADTLRKTKADTVARRLTGTGGRARPDPGKSLRPPLLQQGDFVVVEAGQVIPGDGDVVEGIASVDESAITGESAPVIRESGGDRSAVTGGTTVLSDRIVVKITQKPGESFIDRMIALVEGANRQKTPNEIALNILLAALTIIFVFAVATLQPLAIFSKANNPGVPDTSALNGDGVTGIVMVALLVCSDSHHHRRAAVGDRHRRHGPAGATQRAGHVGRAVEAAGDVNTLLLDKTGTITLGNRQASDFIPVTGVTPEAAGRCRRSCPASPTKPPRAVPSWSIAKTAYGLRAAPRASWPMPAGCEFSATTRMSGVDLENGHRCARARPVRSPMGPRSGRHRPAPSSARSSTASPRPAAPRWWSASHGRRQGRRCLASSTSRTSSSRACANASTRCARWASAR